MPNSPSAVLNSLKGIPFVASQADTPNSVTAGNIWWLSSTHANRADDTAHGHTPLQPFATLDYAIGQCTANNGDVIYVMSNHAETLSAATDAVDFDIAGIKVVGLGNGDDRPTFTFATEAGAVVNVDAANIEITNCVWLCNVASQTRMVALTGNADGAYIHHNLFREGSASGLSMVEWTGAADDVRIEHNTFFAPTAATYDEAILIASTPTRGKISHNFIYGDWDEGGINNAVGNVATLFEISDNQITNLLAGAEAIDLDSAVTGMLTRNSLSTDVIATAIDQGAMRATFNEWSSTTDGTGGVPIPATPADTASADTVLGALYGTGGISAFPAAAIPANSVSLAEVIRQLYAALEGTAADMNGVATWPTAAAYANNVSIAEVLGYIQDGTRRGTGTSLAANESLADVLYATNGIVTFPSAALPANGVSIAEVLREAYDQEDKAVTNTTAVLVTGTTLFTIAGGPIEILSLVARCVTNNDGTASTLQWSADPTDGAAATFSGASASLASVTAGAMVILQGTALTTAPTVATTSVGLSMSGATPTLGIIVGAGIITSTVAVGSTTGTWQHHLRYRPLSRGVTVTGA